MGNTNETWYLMLNAASWLIAEAGPGPGPVPGGGGPRHDKRPHVATGGPPGPGLASAMTPAAASYPHLHPHTSIL